MRGIQKHVLILLLCSIWLGVPSYEIVKASTDVPSIINSDTTWTKIDSPYELKGPVLVSNGVILTIEPGVTVNLNGFYIQVDGTLDAIGSSTDQILFNSGTIRFTEYSTDWDEQTNSGCRIENSDLSSVQIDIINSPKISNNSIWEINVDGMPTITKNTILGKLSISGSPIILENSITNSAPGSVRVIRGSPIISYNTINSRIMISEGLPIISHNTINDGIHVDAHGDNVEIKDNIVRSRGDYYSIFVHGSSATISGNNITGKGNLGIYLSGPYSFFISGNIISDFSTAITANNPCPLTIEWNLLKNNIDGISLTVSASVFAPFEQAWKSPMDFPLTIRNNFIYDNLGVAISLNHPLARIMNNSITNNHVGISIRDPPDGSPLPVILNNNIYANEYNLKSAVPDDINATHNWWGTTDILSINQTIYDFKYDFNVGKVNFVPFLTELNPNIPEFPSWSLLFVMLVAVIVISIVYRHNINQDRSGDSDTV